MSALVALVVATFPAATAQAQGALSVCHDRLVATVEPAGRLMFGANPAPGCGVGPDSFALSFTWPSASTSYTTVRIDGVDHIYDQGTVLTPPTLVGNGIFTRMGFGEVEVSQLVQVGLTNATTGRPDAAQIAYTVDNVSPNQQPHNVGIRFMVDTKVGDSDNPTFFVNNSPVTTETEYVGNVPELFTVQNPNVLSQAAAGALSPNFGAVTPNRFIIGQFGTFSTAWDYPSTGTTIGDSAFAAYWETASLAPGNQATYSMVYGVGPGGQSGGGGGSPIPGCETTEQNQCGTTGDDNLSSSDGRVVGGPGDDTIMLTVDETTNSLTAEGGTGADRILLNIQDPSNISAVRINSGDGADRVFVPRNPGSLSPVVKTGASNDVVTINTQSRSPKVAAALQEAPVGRYTINAGGGSDRVTAGTSNDLVDGAGGDDRLLGAAGLDEIEGGDGNDDMEGGDGGDVLHGGDGANHFAGGRGRDTCLSDTRRDKFNSCEQVRRNHRRNHQAI